MIDLEVPTDMSAHKSESRELAYSQALIQSKSAKTRRCNRPEYTPRPDYTQVYYGLG